MATLSSLTRTTKLARRQRVGRGGKRGTFSGRGTKGQKSRSGRKMRPELRDIIKKVPKLRGYRVRIYRTKPIVISLTTLERVFDAGATVSMNDLIEKKLVNARVAKAQGVKLLGGSLTKALHINGVSVSTSARGSITKAGGTVTEELKKQKTESKTTAQKHKGAVKKAPLHTKEKGEKKAPAKKEAKAKKTATQVK